VEIEIRDGTGCRRGEAGTNAVVVDNLGDDGDFAVEGAGFEEDNCAALEMEPRT
jgi:hypothetical protein